MKKNNTLLVCSNTFISVGRVYGNVLVHGGGKVFFEKSMLIDD
jgi:hypothetical protein